jgi:hypothetical protein
MTVIPGEEIINAVNGRYSNMKGIAQGLSWKSPRPNKNFRKCQNRFDVLRVHPAIAYHINRFFRIIAAVMGKSNKNRGIQQPVDGQSKQPYQSPSTQQEGSSHPYFSTILSSMVPQLISSTRIIP